MKPKLHTKLVCRAALAMLLTAGAALHAQTLTNGLILYAPFANSLSDIVGGHGGTGFNGPTLHASGGVGGGGYVQLQNDAGSPKQAVWFSDPTPATTDFSFQIWVRSADAATAQNGQPDQDGAIAANKDWDAGANVGWVLARETGNYGDQFQWNMNTAGGARKDLDPYSPSATVFDGNWHQLVVTYQRSGNAIFYRDAVVMARVGISANTGSMRPTLNAWITNNILALGEDATLQYDHGTGTALNGDLDEAATWDRVLSPEEVAAAYAKGNAGLTLTTASGPVFVHQPQGGTRYTSDNFRLSCLVGDDRGPVTYQWYQGSTAVAGATTGSFLLTNLTTASAGNYTVVVSDGVGSVTSAPAALVVLAASPITTGLAVYLNFDDNITAQAGTAISGTAIGNDPTAKFTAGQIGRAATFNNDGSSPSGWSSDWAVSLGDIEWIYTNNWSFSLWVNETNNANDLALLGNKDWTSGGNVGWVFAPYNNVEVNYYSVGGPRRDIGGANVLNSQWHHVAAVFNRDANTVFVYVDGQLTSSASVGFAGWESLTPNTFTPNATLVGSSGNQPYSGAGAIDDLGIWARALTADEVLAIYAQGLVAQPLTTAVAGAAIRPTITGEPQGLSLFEGGKATLTVAAAGSTPLSYQWYRNNSPVTGATSATLSFYPVSTNDAGNYVVVVTNRYGSITSAPPAALTVHPITGISSGLAVYLNFDNNIDAQGGTTNNGTAIGSLATPTYTSGRIGSAAFFNNDGSGGISSDWAVSLGDVEWIYAGSWSLSLWVNATNANDGALLGNKDWNSGGDIGWVFDPSRSGNGFGGKGFLNWTCVGGPRQDPGGADLMGGIWHHVAAVFDRDVNKVTIYVDGNVTGVTNLAVIGNESLTPTGFPNDTLVGGSGNDTWSGQGAVDDVGIWARPLSAQEILAVFVQGLNSQPLTSASASAIKPLIINPPQSQTRMAGLPASFSVTAAGSAPLAYQWRMNGVNLIGETNTSLYFPTAPGDSGTALSVVVSNPYGAMTSSPPAILTVTPAPAAITNGLVVYLNFESNILAQAGTTNNGTAIGTVGVETYTPGIVGRSAASFNNDDSDSPVVSDWAVSLGDIEWIYSNNWSFAVWIKTTDNYGALLGNKNWYSGNNIGWVISEYYTDWLNYRAENSPRHDIGNFNWADGVWHHVAAVFYRDANLVYTYVDGALTAQVSLSATGAESLTDPAIMTTLVGSSGDSHESGYGDVDDLGMWARALTQSELMGIYQAGLQGRAVPQATPGAPSLSATLSGGSVWLVYPGWAKGYTLESRSSITSGSWTTVTATPSVLGGNSLVVLPAEGTQFFRLRR